MMAINYFAVGACAVLSMVVGSVWFGPLFGRAWMKIIGANAADAKARADMQKRAMPLYAAQFFLTLFQVWVLAQIIARSPGTSAMEHALWLWAAFVMPIVAGGAMWNNDSAKVSWTRFLIQAGYQLVMFMLFGFILGMWR